MGLLFQHATSDPCSSIVVIPDAVRPDEKKYRRQGGENCQNRDELFFHGFTATVAKTMLPVKTVSATRFFPVMGDELAPTVAAVRECTESINIFSECNG